MTAENPFVEWVERYRGDPVAFCREVIGFEPDPWQAETLMAIASGERRMAIRSGHGVGKSFTAAVAMIWFLLTRFPVKIVVTAPTSAQLYDALFAELRGRVQELPEMIRELLDVNQDRVWLKAAPDDAFISARTSRAEKPEALQGVHSENVLLVADEASGIPEQVFEAARGSMSGEHATTLLLGNPTRTSGYFFRCFHANAHRWWTRRVSCLDSHRVSADFVQDVIEDFGPESNQYRIRVLGEFPTTDDDVMISLELVQQAMEREIALVPGSKVTWGLDVARFGSDRSVLAKRSGQVVTSIRAWRNLDTMQLVGAVLNEYRTTPDSERPHRIFVDVIGLGAGVVDRLKELGLPVVGINVSEAPSLGETYVNLRAELWGRMKQWLESRTCALPKNDYLLSELTSVKYFFSSSGKLQIEPKDAMKKRGLASPDVADAVILTLAGDGAAAMYGRRAGSAGQPLRRRLKGVA